MTYAETATFSSASPGARWRTAAVLGLISSTYSTFVSQLAAERVGRDAAVDWMSVAAIPARDWAISLEPSTAAVAIGIAFHQWADFSWALFFFGLLGRWTSQLKPAHLAWLAFPWAAATSSLEWFVLVPLVPFWQPIFTLQQPLWIGLIVHLSSAIVYPLFPWMLAGNRLAPPDRRFAVAWAAGLAGLLAILITSALLGSRNIEIGWIGRDPAVDQTFMRHMSTHHQQGVELATLAVDRAADPHLRSLARLMVASQNGEIRIMDQWWQRWFSPTMQLCTSSEAASMPGYLTEAQIDLVRTATGEAFDSRFIEAMTIHHQGAAVMADGELYYGSDVRLRAFAHSVRHAQQGEIALMNGASGVNAVRSAVMHMFRSPSYDNASTRLPAQVWEGYDNE